MSNAIFPEQMVLGSVIMNGTLFEKLELKNEHFGDDRHQVIYKAMEFLYKKGTHIDIGTIAGALGENVKSIGSVSYLADLTEFISSEKSLENYEQDVFKDYRAKKDHELIVEFNKDRTDENRDMLIKELENLQLVGIKDDRQTTKEAYFEIAEEIIEGTPPLQDGYKTGLDDYDRMTGGSQRGKLTILAGRPGMAKTALAVHFGMKLSEDGGVPHFMTYEMGMKDLLKRIISTTSNMSGDVWITNKFKEEDYNKAIRAIGVLSEQDFEIYENVKKVRQMKATMRQAIDDEPSKKHMLIVDGVNFLEAEDLTQNKTSRIEEVTQDLKMLATELDIPVILVSQINRGVEQREDKRPVMSDLKDSGSLEQLSDVIAFLYRDSYYNEDSEDQGVAEVIIAKHRQGPKGTIKLSFTEDIGKFLNLN